MPPSGLVRFPARVETPLRVYDRVKLIVHEGVATIYRLSGASVPEAALVLEDVQSVEHTGGGRVNVLRAADGTVWTVHLGSGCGGCGNPLARYDPRPRPHTASR